MLSFTENWNQKPVRLGMGSIQPRSLITIILHIDCYWGWRWRAANILFRFPCAFSAWATKASWGCKVLVWRENKITQISNMKLLVASMGTNVHTLMGRNCASYKQMAQRMRSTSVKAPFNNRRIWGTNSSSVLSNSLTFIPIVYYESVSRCKMVPHHLETRWKIWFELTVGEQINNTWQRYA